jgi:hypothetical protein
MTEGSNVAAEPIADPIVNGPYDPPQRHFELGADGSPTGVIVSGRRPSESFIPVPAVTKRRRQAAVQESFDLGSDGERREANTLINDIRYQVELWRNRNYPGATAISRKLMLHWAEPSRENRVLYCQREAAETAIYLAEVAGRHGEPDFRTRIDPQNALHNDGLSHRPRPACRCVDERPARDQRMRVAELTPSIAVVARELDPFHGDLADRIIVATAAALGIPLVAKDHRMHEFAWSTRCVQFVW